MYVWNFLSAVGVEVEGGGGVAYAEINRLLKFAKLTSLNVDWTGGK